MGNGVVSIRVKGVSITIVDGNIAIEQTRTESAAVAVPKVDEGLAAASRQALPESPGSLVQASPTIEAVLASAAATERVAPLPKVADSTVSEESGAAAPVIDKPDRPLGRNGPAGLPGEAKPVPLGDPVRPSGHSGKAQGSGQTKPVWTDEEIQKLTALYPTHSAGAIAVELGRGLNSVRAKAQHLGLRKDGPPAVTVKPAKPAPRSLSAAVTEPLPPPLLPSVTDQFGGGVPLLEHHSGQCRWIISDWPAVYCGAPVVGSSSWCEQHSRRVFTPGRKALPAFPGDSGKGFG